MFHMPGKDFFDLLILGVDDLASFSSDLKLCQLFTFQFSVKFVIADLHRTQVHIMAL